MGMGAPSPSYRSDIAEGKVQTVRAVVNPDKLAHLT
jgi:hypothetical protein